MTVSKRAKKSTYSDRMSDDDENNPEGDGNDDDSNNDGEIDGEDLSFINECPTQRSTIENIAYEGNDPNFDMTEMEIIMTVPIQCQE